MKRTILILFVLFALLSCSQNRDKSEGKHNGSNNGFPYTEVPRMVNDPSQVSIYYATHFWDNYFKLDSLQKKQLDSAEFEQAYSNYLYALVSLQQVKGDLHAADIVEKKLFKCADSLYQTGDKVLLGSLLKNAEKYLYDPNSPMLNEELYIPVLEQILNMKSLNEIDKMQYVYQLKMAKLNRRGTKAADIKYKYISNGGLKDGSLYGLTGDYVLIYFNNPDCTSCAEMLTVLKSSQAIEQLVHSGKMKILSMYIDEDRELWRSKSDAVPKEWIYACDYDSQFSDNSIYGIRAIPSFYLLDNEKNVLIKDAPTPEAIMKFFETVN